jgi:hypothetical protein
MGQATMMNGFVAAAAGVSSNYLVKRTSNYLAPFMASLVLLLIAFVVIESLWEENKAIRTGASPVSSAANGQSVRLKHAWGVVQRGSLLSL